MVLNLVICYGLITHPDCSLSCKHRIIYLLTSYSSILLIGFKLFNCTTLYVKFINIILPEILIRILYC